MAWTGRAQGLAAAADEAPFGVVRVDPCDGQGGVFRDSPIVVRLSHAVEAATLPTGKLSVEDAAGPVPGRLLAAPDPRILIWRAERLLTAGTPHFVLASGFRDGRGRALRPHLSHFVPCDLSRGDFPG